MPKRKKHGQLPRPTNFAVPRAGDALRHVPLIMDGTHADDMLAADRKRARSSASAVALKSVVRRLVMRITSRLQGDGLGVRWTPFDVQFHDAEEGALLPQSAKRVRLLAMDFPRGPESLDEDVLFSALEAASQEERAQMTAWLEEADAGPNQEAELEGRITAVGGVFRRIFEGLVALRSEPAGVALILLPSEPPSRIERSLSASAEELAADDAKRHHRLAVLRLREVLGSEEGAVLHGGAGSARLMKGARVTASQASQIAKHPEGIAAAVLALREASEGEPALRASELRGFGARVVPFAREQGRGNAACVRDPDQLVVCAIDKLTSELTSDP